MEKNKPGTKTKKAASSTNIIKRNIENVKNPRNKSKENMKPKDKPSNRSRSEKPKKPETKDLKTNPASNNFESIKSPVPPNKISPVKNKQSSTPIVKKDSSAHDTLKMINEKIEDIDSQNKESIGEKEEKNNVPKDLSQIIEDRGEVSYEMKKNQSPVKTGICVIKASSAKRKRDLNEEEDYMTKSIKNSL